MIEPIKTTLAISQHLMIDGDADKPLPNEFRLLPLGEMRTHNGDLYTTPDSLALVVQEFYASGNELAIDYDHQSMYATEHSGAVPAAGWIRDLEQRNDGLYAANVTWTPKAAECLKSREYRYFSPVVYFEPESRLIVAVDSPALTNRPATHNLLPLVASRGRKTPDMAENTASQDVKEANETAAAKPTEKLTKADLEAQLLAVSSDMQRIHGLVGTADAKAVIETLSQWQRDSNLLEQVIADRDAMKEELSRQRRERLIEGALHEGKLSLAQTQEGAFARIVSLETLETYLETAPALFSRQNYTAPSVSESSDYDSMLETVRAEFAKSKTPHTELDIQVETRKRLGLAKG